MYDIRQITDWRVSRDHGPVYERLLGALGSDAFGPTVRDAILGSCSGVRRLYLFEAKGQADSSLQYYFGEPGLVNLFPDYLRWYQRQDPVTEAYQAAPRVADVALQRVRPDHIQSPGFRRRVFDEAGIVERVSVIQRGPDAWRVMNVARHESEGCFTDEELSALVGIAFLALPMLPLNRERRARVPPLSVAQLEERFAERCGMLTPRERQVCARAAAGMSVDDTAQDLCIARTSVLTYRRRAYERLDVHSPVELCALVAQ
jgi:DNA-binding CsgD family transcriptional regulator